ncbi:cysteine proteinase, partial [Gloeophyllum trabeum ATCC 11539]
RDMEFDLEEDREGCLYGLETDEKCKPPDVLRVTQIFTEADSTPDAKRNGGATADDLVQGQLEDCWFLAALATVCTASTGKETNWIEEHISVAHHPRIGVYGFIFFRDGCWEDVVIDDLLFVHSPKYETLPPEEQLRFRRDKHRYDTEARTGSKSLYFASSGTEGETWVPLIEKAFAKLNGDYAALNYGFVCDAVESLTGLVPRTSKLLFLSQERFRGVYNCFHLHDVLDRDKFWNEELMKHYEEHAYSVIDAIEHPETKKRFLKIRNPWGSGGEWDGPWSDGSSEWTQLFPIDVDKLNHTFGNDGQFIMEYDDFMSTWSYVDRTKLFNRRWVYSFHWLNVSARPRPSAWSPGDVSFTVKIAKRTPAIFVLSQLDDRAFQELSGCYKWSFDFVVYKEGPEKREVGRSTHERLWRRSVNLELDNLEEGTYIVHVWLYVVGNC